MNCLYKFLCKVYRKVFLNDDLVIRKISDDAPWALVSYIPFALTHWYDDEFLDEHQSRREMFEIVRVLQKLGYNLYIVSPWSNPKLPEIDFKLVFGLEPAFCEACKKYPNAKKIYYATGAFVEHQNSMVRCLTDEFNTKYQSNIPYRRTAPENNAAYLADHILQIGSSYTIQTYPEELRNKVTTIHQSSQAIKTIENIAYAQENEFFFMSSGGNILKGVPQMIECFSKHPDKILHVVGPIEDDVKDAMKSVITDNIIFHGFMNVNSVEYLNVIKRCNFTVYPSCSEGMPGAVLNCMKNGLIPIVTQWSAFDEINEYGYVLDDVYPESIHKSLEWAESLCEDTIMRMKTKSKEYVERNYTMEKFASEYKLYIESIMR